MTVALLIPVLRRPHRVGPLLKSIADATPAPHRVVFIATPTDRATHEAIMLDATASLLFVDGNYAMKINAGIQATSEPLVFIGADDLHFHRGWFEQASAKITDTIGLVGTQDLCNPRVLRGEHATHFLMARWYAELGSVDGRPGPMCELYPHEFVDDELVGTAKHRRAWAFAEDSIVEHLHPDVGKAPMDDLYAQRRRRMRQGRRIFDEREPLWTQPSR